jgi:hypothetical protein
MPISEAKDYLKSHNVKVSKVTDVKPPAVAYIDDRAVRFTARSSAADAMGQVVELDHPGHHK